MSVLSEEPYPLRAIFAQSTNPLSATRQPELVAKALEKLNFFFVMDMFHNPSCDYADIVLPAASQYECSHLIAMRNFHEGTFLGMSQKIADPPGIAKDYPYAFSDVHAHRFSNHSYYGDIAQIRRFALEPWVKINPDTASKNGIEDGDWIEAESPHGWCILQACLTEGVAPDVLMGRRGWWQGCPDAEPGRGFRIVKEEAEGVFPFVSRLFKSKARAGCDCCQSLGGYPHCVLTCPSHALKYE